MRRYTQVDRYRECNVPRLLTRRECGMRQSAMSLAGTDIVAWNIARPLVMTMNNDIQSQEISWL